MGQLIFHGFQEFVGLKGYKDVLRSRSLALLTFSSLGDHT